MSLPSGILSGLGAPADPISAALGQFPCARLRNVPIDVSVQDIVGLLQGLVVIDVLFTADREVFVMFANPMDHQMALQRNRQSLRGHVIEVYQASRQEYYNAIAMHQQRKQLQRVNTTSLPLQEKFFLGEDREKHGMDLSGAKGSVAGGLIPVQMLQQYPVGTQQYPSLGTPHGGDVVMAQASDSLPEGGGKKVKQSKGGTLVGKHTGYLRLRGLPFAATVEDIAKFLSNYRPVPGSIVLTYRRDGRATGEAYVMFESPEDSERAMNLQGQSIGKRYIELFLSDKEEHSRAINRFGNKRS